MASSGLNLPSYYTDPYYSQAQSYLMPYSQNLLEGKIPDYYAPIGEWGGKNLEDIIGLTSRDITNATESSLASSGMARSGLAGASIGSKVGDVSTSLRWQDFLRAMTGRQNLMQYGLGTMGDVRSAGLTNQGQQNQFNLGMYSADQASQNATNTGWGNMLGPLMGAGANIFGMNQFLSAKKPSASTTTPSSGTMGGIDLSFLDDPEVGEYVDLAMTAGKFAMMFA